MLLQSWPPESQWVFHLLERGGGILKFTHTPEGEDNSSRPSTLISDLGAIKKRNRLKPGRGPQADGTTGRQQQLLNRPNNAILVPPYNIKIIP